MKLLLVDATNAVMRRAMVATEMTAEQAAEDATTRVVRAARDLGATHMIAVFDDPRGNWRYAIYPDYKGAQSSPGTSTRPYADAMWKRMGAHDIYRVIVPGFEADDVIATLVNRVNLSGRPVWTLSSDNDLLQVLKYQGVHVIQYAPSGESPWLVERTPQFVYEKFGVSPDAYPDYLALVGGKNNVKGVPRVGAKTATKWLTEYCSLESLSKAGKLDDEQMLTATSARHLHRLREDVPVPPVYPETCRVPRG